MMRGIEEVVPEQSMAGELPVGGGDSGAWRQVLFTPITFPLTVGGTSFGLIVAFASSAENFLDGLYFSVAGIAYAAVTGVTVYAAGHANRRASQQTRQILGRIAGILLTAIAVTLLASGGTRLVLDALASGRP
jgi:multiple antibiotic resistance protein